MIYFSFHSAVAILLDQSKRKNLTVVAKADLYFIHTNYRVKFSIVAITKSDFTIFALKSIYFPVIVVKTEATQLAREKWGVLFTDKNNTKAGFSKLKNLLI